LKTPLHSQRGFFLSFSIAWRSVITLK